MDTFYQLVRFFHVMSFVFMSVPLFNLIVVNERALLGVPFNFYADRYMENIIRHGAYRCYVFQSTVFVTGLLLLLLGPFGIRALWKEWIILIKTILLFVLMGTLSYVHFTLQPRIESLLSDIDADSKVPDDLLGRLKPYRVRRKKMATLCLFLAITGIILGLQIREPFGPLLNVILIGVAGIFSLKVNKTLTRFGWI